MQSSVLAAARNPEKGYFPGNCTPSDISGSASPVCLAAQLSAGKGKPAQQWLDKGLSIAWKGQLRQQMLTGSKRSVVWQARQACAELRITPTLSQADGKVVTILRDVIQDSGSELLIVIATSVPEQLGIAVIPDEVPTPCSTVGGESSFLRVQDEGAVSVVFFDKTLHSITFTPRT